MLFYIRQVALIQGCDELLTSQGSVLCHYVPNKHTVTFHDYLINIGKV